MAAAPASHPLPDDLHDRLCALLPGLAQDILASVETVGQNKGDDGLDLVTSVDLAMQDRLQEALPALLPGSRVVGEEGYAEQASSGALWLVDPLDGTVNFVAGLPAYAVAVVLMVDGEAVLAAVYDPPHDDLYSARLGHGAWLNGVPLRPRNHDARLGIVSSGLLRDLATHAPRAQVELLASYKLRNFGSQALHLCHAAAGRVDFVASREAKGWDDLAGALIACESGLRYGTYAPQDMQRAMDHDQFSLCAAPAVFDALAPLFARALRAA